MIVELIKLAALPVVIGGALMGADVSALFDAYEPTTKFTQVGQHGVGKDSAAEIVASDGVDLLVYSNSEKGSVDFVNIADPSTPVADGSESQQYCSDTRFELQGSAAGCGGLAGFPG